MAAIFGWVFAGPWLTLGAVLLTLNTGGAHPASAAFLAGLAAIWVAPLRTDGSAAWPAFRDSPVWDAWRRYFGMTLVTPDGEEGGGGGGDTPPPLGPHIIAQFPHGVFPIGSFLTPLGRVACLPAGTVGAIATVLFHLPLLRHIYAWFGCIPADRASIEAALASGKCVGLVPEGVAGVFAGATPEAEPVLTAHKGFIKLALRAPGGVPTPIRPAFIFGQSRALSFWGSRRASRALRATVGVWWGRAGLPCLPRRVRLVMAVGRAVRLAPPAVAGAPSQAEIEAGFQAVLAELARVYEVVQPGVEGYERARLVAVAGERRGRRV